VPGFEAGSSNMRAPSRSWRDAMKTGARVGLAITAGYVLGRLHKMKWALALAVLAGRKRLPGGSVGLLEQGAKVLASSPELAKLTEEMRGQLVEAGKAAAVAAVSGKINSLSDELRERSESMRAASAGGDGGAASGGEEDVEDERYFDEDRAGDHGSRRHRDEDTAGRDEAERIPAPRSESDRAPVSRGPRRRERPAAGDRGDDSSRRDVERNGPRRHPAGSQPRSDGRSRPRSTTSGTGGDSE
jgi:hypothetical protein